MQTGETEEHLYKAQLSQNEAKKEKPTGQTDEHLYKAQLPNNEK